MDTRREFLRTGLTLGAAFSLTDMGGLFAADAQSAAPGAGPRPVLVAVRDGDRVAMLDKAIAELGGMGAFVKKGQSVVVKPNIGWDVPPALATHGSRAAGGRDPRPRRRACPRSDRPSRG